MPDKPTLRQRVALAVLGNERALTANDAIRGLWAGVQTSTGLRVDETTSLQVISVFTAIKILSEGFAQIPLKVYRKEGDVRSEARSNHLYDLLHDAPNERMTAFAMREHWMMALGLWGNSCTEIVRNNRGEIDSLWPLHPAYTKKERLPDGRIIYRVKVNSDPSGYVASQTEVVLRDDQVLHIPGFSLDGFWGLSPIRQIRENIGLSDAYTQFAGRFFDGDAMDFALFTERVMQQPQLDEMHKEWTEKHGGIKNRHNLAIFHGGLKPEKIGMPLDDAQFIEQRDFSREEIFGFYRIPPNFWAADKVSSWGTGIEQMSIGFVKFTLDPWFVRAEQALNLKFLSANAQGPLFAEFDREGFLRGDFKTRIQGYKDLFNLGVMSNVGIAKIENLPAPPTEVWLVPSNMTPVDKIDAIADKAAAPDPAPVVAPPAPQSDNAANRVALIASQRPAFLDAVDRVLRRAAFDTAKEREKRKDDADYERWLADFAADHRAFCAKHLATPLNALAEVVRSDVSRETGKEVPVFPTLLLSQLEQFAERVAVAIGPAEDVVRAELFRIANLFAEMAYQAIRVDAEPVVIDGFPMLIAYPYANKPEARERGPVVNITTPAQLAQPPVIIQPAPVPPVPMTPEVQYHFVDREGIEKVVAEMREAEVKPEQVQQMIDASNERMMTGFRDLIGGLKESMTPPPAPPPIDLAALAVTIRESMAPTAPALPPVINLTFPADAIKVEVKPGDVHIHEGAIQSHTPVNVHPPLPAGDMEVTPKNGGGFTIKRNSNGVN